MVSIIFRSWITAIMILISTPALGAAPCKKVGSRELVEFDFRQTPLRDITRWISCARSLNVMFQTKAIANIRVTWISSRKVKGRSLKARFEAMLGQHELRLRRTGGFFVIESSPRDHD